MWLTALFLSGCGDDGVPCAERSPDACGDDCGTLSGRAIVDGCVQGDFVDLGCLDLDLGCDDVLTVATDPEGQLWWFSDSCVPAGYTGDGTSIPPDC